MYQNMYYIRITLDTHAKDTEPGNIALMLGGRTTSFVGAGSSWVAITFKSVTEFSPGLWKL